MTHRRSWLPRPVEGVEEGIILFDGVCVLCSGWVRFIIERDPAARFRFLAIQSDAGHALARALAIDAEAPETNAVILGGVAYFKSDAAIAVLSRLPGLRGVGFLSILPRALRDPAYDLMARNRYRLFGKNPTCLLPTAATAKHFL